MPASILHKSLRIDSILSKFSLHTNTKMFPALIKIYQIEQVGGNDQQEAYTRSSEECNI